MWYRLLNCGFHLPASAGTDCFLNRIRSAYLELHPELEPHFIASPYDDLPGALHTLGIDVGAARGLGSALHVFQTLPGMLSMIVAVVAGAIGALIGLAFAIAPVGVIAAGGAAFLVAVTLMGLLGRRSVRRADPSLEPRFPSPKT